MVGHLLPIHQGVASFAPLPLRRSGILFFLCFPRGMSVFSRVSRCAAIFGHLLDTMSELVEQGGPSAGEFTTSGLEMALRLLGQPSDWEMRSGYSSLKQTAEEEPSSPLEFHTLSMHSSSLPLLLVFLVYHEITSLLVSKAMLAPSVHLYARAARASARRWLHRFHLAHTADAGSLPRKAQLAADQDGRRAPIWFLE
jgi:hypothetical protein